jgi:hypothetical protein
MKTAGSSDGYGGDNDDERVEGEAFGGGTGNVDNVAVEPPAAGGGGEVSGGEDTNYTCLELGRCPIKTVQKGTTWSRLYLMMFKAHLEDLGFTLQGPNPLAGTFVILMLELSDWLVQTSFLPISLLKVLTS